MFTIFAMFTILAMYTKQLQYLQNNCNTMFTKFAKKILQCLQKKIQTFERTFVVPFFGLSRLFPPLAIG